jgi:hypothetical protein
MAISDEEAWMLFRDTRTTATAAIVTALIAAAACGDKNNGPTSTTGGPPPGLAACGSAPFLTVPLVSAGNIFAVSPLGNLNPPPHTFPTDHIYLYMNPPSAIYAPGSVVLTNVVVQHRTGGGQPPVDDYVLVFYPCADVQLGLAHVANLSVQLRTRVGTLDGVCNPSYQTGGFTYQQCSKTVDISLAAGDGIGTSAASLDVLARDRRVTLSWENPARLSDPDSPFGDKHVACPIDYFVASVADPMRDKARCSGNIRTACRPSAAKSCRMYQHGRGALVLPRQSNNRKTRTWRSHTTTSRPALARSPSARRSNRFLRAFTSSHPRRPVA